MEEKEIKDYILKLSGKASLLQEIENDKEYNLRVNGETTAKTEVPNGDGSYNIIYKFQPKIIEIEGEGGEIIKTKDLRKKSQKLRGALYYLWQEQSGNLDQDEFYDRFMDKLLANLNGVVEYLHNIKDK